jgi:hypothetical protein
MTWLPLVDGELVCTDGGTARYCMMLFYSFMNGFCQLVVACGVPNAGKNSPLHEKRHYFMLFPT